MSFSEFKEKKQQFDDSRYGSIIKLSIWIILLIFFASFVRGNTSTSEPLPIADVVSKPTSVSIKEKFKSINSYDADVSVLSDS